MDERARQDIAQAAGEAAAALWAFERMVAKHAGASIGEDMALAVVATKAAAQEALSALAGRFPAKRTPETVLRAMLRAYEAAIVTARRGDGFDMPMFDTAVRLRRRAHAIQDSLASHLDGGAELDLLSLHEADAAVVERDYEARLFGQRPLDAPPMEEP